jgi:RHS repeat-associated protein
MKRAFVYLGNELVGTVVNGNEARYYINDHLGTTELVTDANGNILSQIQHTPFGDEVVVQSGTSSSSNSEDYYFTGKELDATGLYYFGARYYDPEVGLFISEDPSQDGLNWYEYCRANPLKYVDPDGRAVIIPVVIYMYITALAASPDLQMDIQLLCYDLSAGDYTSAAADIIGLALPGLPASVTNAPKRWLSGWLAKHGDELINLLKYEGHHLWPKYLKGPSQQFLSKMIRFKHIKLHMALDQIFRRTLGAEAFENIPIDELYKALLKFYKENYPELVDEFIKNAQNIMRNL